MRTREVAERSGPVNEPFLKRFERIPVPLLPTMVAAATLANVYDGLGFHLVRHLTMWAGTAVVLAYLCKLVVHPRTCKAEYCTTVPCSLYAGLTMLTMILGSYYHAWFPAFGKTIWLAALLVHAVHIIVFTWRNVIANRVVDTFVPSWFVTYNGIMVSCVVGGVMNEPTLLRIVTYYGIAVYFLLLFPLIARLRKHELKPGMLHTLAIFLAPCSLCLVSYLNVAAAPAFALTLLLYLCVAGSLLFFFYMLPRFFSVPFSPAFAGLTFPMAIGIVASLKMSTYLVGRNDTAFGAAAGQLAGVQLYVTTAIVGMVLFNFAKLLFGKPAQTA